MSEPVRYGVIGCVGIGGTHAEAVAEADGATLVACADVVPENAEEFAADHDCAAYTDHVEMIEDADVDAVSVCTPSGTHADIAVDCAAAGANILCEKPLDVYLDRVDRMLDAAEEHGVTLAGVFQRRTAPAAQRAKRAVEEGDLGDLVFADVQTKWHRSADYYASGEWRGTREMDGGVLMNQAVHGTDLLQWLAGGVETVDAACETVAHDIEVEDTALVTLEFTNGARGTLEATTATYPNNPVVVELNGRDGTLVLEDDSVARFETREGTVEFDGEEHDWGAGHGAVVQDFVDALREGREPLVPGRAAARAVEINLAIYESAARGEPVRVDDLRGLEPQRRTE
jgi:predicted dehydrogenase